MFTKFMDHGREISHYGELKGGRVNPHTMEKLQQYETLEDCELLRREVWRESNNANDRLGLCYSFPAWQLRAIEKREEQIKSGICQHGQGAACCATCKFIKSQSSL